MPVVSEPIAPNIVNVPLSTPPTKIVYHAGNTYQFAPGTYEFSTAGIALNVNDVKIRGATDSQGHLLTYFVNTIPIGSEKYASTYSLNRACNRVKLTNIGFIAQGSPNIAVNVKGSNIILENDANANCYLAQLRGCD